MDVRKGLYKDSHKGDPASQKKIRINQQNVIRKKHREDALRRKRFRHNSDKKHHKDYTIDDVSILAKELCQKPLDKRTILLKLQKAFSQGSALTEAFMKVDGALQNLVGLLSGTDEALQLQAASCITNMAAASELDAPQLISQAAPYLITLLDSHNYHLQDQCANALGNLACGVDESRKVLLIQGTVHSLLPLLKSPHSCVVHSATFALSNMSRDLEAQKVLIENGILVDLENLLKISKEQIMESAWLSSYLTANPEFKEIFANFNILETLIVRFIEITNESINDNVEIITPILRCIGNLLCCTPEQYFIERQIPELFFTLLIKVVSSEYIHLQKEGLWVLSNFTALNSICGQYFNKEIIEAILSTLSSTFEIKKEGLFCLCNYASHSTLYAANIIEVEGTFSKLIPLLKSHDLELVHLNLCLLEMILNAQPVKAKELFEINGGLDALELHEYSNNEEIRVKTTSILENYFYAEDKKEKSTDCDSALIPLLCVHG